MPPAQKPTGAEGAARALPREQPVTAAAATPTPVNNESAGAEGAEFIAQDLSQDPPGNDDLLSFTKGKGEKTDPKNRFLGRVTAGLFLE